MDVSLVKALLHRINGMKGASYGAKAMCDGREPWRKQTYGRSVVVMVK